MKRIISFQIVQGYAAHVALSPSRSLQSKSYSPDVVALDEDGVLWVIGLSEFNDYGAKWKRLTPAPTNPGEERYE